MTIFPDTSAGLYMTGATTGECWPLVRDFHYSKRMPSAIQYCFAWRQEGGLFGDTGEPQAVIIYGNPVNRNWPQDALELQRLVRRPDFNLPLSSFVAWSLRWLRANTTVPFVLSYADSGEGHHGGIYQASGFSFVALSKPRQDGITNTKTGEFIHGRQVGREFGTQCRDVVGALLPPDWELAWKDEKYLYVKPLRQKLKSLLRRFDWQQLPFPKPDNATCPLDDPLPSGVSAVQPREVAP